MINLVVEAFEGDVDFLRKYQEKFQYILLDEFQDTNTAQNKVVTLLAQFWGEAANIFAVGDDEQSIYRFQGASLENILYFKKLYPGALVIALKENYRSVQGLLDASYELIQHNQTKITDYIKGVERKLTAAAPGTQKNFWVGHFSGGVTESFFVGSKIKELVESGVRPSAIAVLYRHNSDGAEFADMLSRLGIPNDLQAGGDVLKDNDLDKLLRLLEVILKIRTKEEDLDLFTLFNYEFLARQFGFSYLDSLKLARFASDLKVNFVEAILHPDFSKNKIVANPQSFLTFVNQLIEWQKESANATFVAFFEQVVNESGFLDWILSLPDNVEKLNRLNSLFSEVKKLNALDHRLSLERFFDDLGVLRESRIAINEEDLDIKTESVVLTTVHGAKGLEFDYVFVVKALDGKFGNNHVRQLIKLPPNILSVVEGTQVLPEVTANEDERRLFYVALTRARQGVFISFADSYSSDQYAKQSVPTMFLSEISQDKKSDLSAGRYEKEVKEILHEILKVVGPNQSSIEEKEFLSSVLADFRLSVTALNTYLECPYKFKLNNLLRTPRAKDKYLVFGSAVHRGLELMMREFKSTDHLPTAQFLVDQFESALQKEIMTEADFEDILKKGRKILRAYYDFYKDTFVRPVFTEKFFGYGFSKIYLGDIPLTGKVDRIDFLGERSGGRPTVKMVDYKTGKVKSRNEVEGRTKQGDLSYKRQLIFYKILADLDTVFNYEVVEAELDFVEGKEGKFVRHSFVISPEETEELKRIIKEVMGGIRRQEFPRTTNYDYCTYCEFKSHCWPEGIPVKTGGQLELFSQTKE